MLLEKQIQMLACPDCLGAPLRYSGTAGSDNIIRQGELICRECLRLFRISEGVPILLPRGFLDPNADKNIEATIPMPESWKAWYDRLGLFEQWRQQTWKDKNKKRKAIAIRNAERIRDTFMEFCNLKAGKILEIGCGSGAIRSSPLWPRDLEYWGLDPIILDPAHYQFPFIAGFAEHLPFKDRSFTQVLVKDSLDHFNNIEQFCDQTHRALCAGGHLIIGQLLKANSSSQGCEFSSHPLSKIIRGFRALLFARFDDFMDGFKRNLKIGGKRVSADETHLWHFNEEEIEKVIRHYFQIEEKELIDGYLLIRAQRP